jgi:MYXO-CTERM domain-containing protein
MSGAPRDMSGAPRDMSGTTGGDMSSAGGGDMSSGTGSQPDLSESGGPGSGQGCGCRVGGDSNRSDGRLAALVAIALLALLRRRKKD